MWSPICEDNNQGGEMVNQIASRAVGFGSIPSRVKPKVLKLVCAASSLSTQHLGVKTKTCQPRVISACSFREVARLKFNSACWSCTKQNHLSSLVNVLVLFMYVGGPQSTFIHLINQSKVIQR